jgi:hypothetical protein
MMMAEALKFSVGSVEAPDNADYRCKVLWAAVVRRAVSDWVLYVGSDDIRKRRLFYDAHRWLFINAPDFYEITNFHTVCQELDLGSDVIREKVRRLTKQEIQALRGMEFGYND